MLQKVLVAINFFMMGMNISDAFNNRENCWPYIFIAVLWLFVGCINMKELTSKAEAKKEAVWKEINKKESDIDE